MLESFIIGALSSLVISAFYFLFKKTNKKSHLYIQNTILIITAILCLIAFVATLTTLTEFPILILPILIVVVPSEFFVVKKLINNFKALDTHAFEISENTTPETVPNEKTFTFSLTKKKLLIIISVALVITLAIVIPLSIIGTKHEKQVITLKKANLEDYFYVETSFSQINDVAQIKYSITPKYDYAKEVKSGDTIKVTLAVTFYKYSNTSGSPIETEYIHINLQKTKNFEKIGSGTVDVPENAKGYKIYVSYANGTIFS